MDEEVWESKEEEEEDDEDDGESESLRWVQQSHGEEAIIAFSFSLSHTQIINPAHLSLIQFELFSNNNGIATFGVV